MSVEPEFHLRLPRRLLPVPSVRPDMDLLMWEKQESEPKEDPAGDRPRFGYHEKTAVVSVEEQRDDSSLPIRLVGISDRFVESYVMQIRRIHSFDIGIRIGKIPVAIIRFIYLLVDRLPIQCRNIENQTELFHSNFGPGYFL